MMVEPVKIQIQNADPKNIPIAESVKIMKKDFAHIVEMQKYGAKLKREYFMELVESGFTEEQAMWLIK